MGSDRENGPNLSGDPDLSNEIKPLSFDFYQCNEEKTPQILQV